MTAFRVIPFQINLKKKNLKKLLLLGFFLFRILLLKIPFQRAHTLVFKQMNGRAIFKNLSIFSRGPSLKINKKKKFQQAPQTTSNKHTSYSCCSLVIFLDF
jgi:hypothetical protein